MSAKAKSSLTPEQRKATLRRVLEKIRPYRFFVGCSLIVAAVSVAAQLYIPILCGSAIDLMLGKGRVDFAGVMQIIVQIVAVAILAAFAQWMPPCGRSRPFPSPTSTATPPATSSAG